MKSLFLVGCSNQKKNCKSQAKEIYISERFKKSAQLAETYSDRWFIVSGKHHLLDPSEIISPYDCSINDKKKKEKKNWNKILIRELRAEITDKTTIICIGDKNYFEGIVEEFKNSKVKIYNVFKHIPKNRRIEWLNHFLKSSQHKELQDKLYDLVYSLAKQNNKIMKFGNCSGYMNWPSRGIYLYFNPQQYRLFDFEKPKIVRVGTHGVSKGSKSTLWQRLKTHQGTSDGLGNHRGSVFRKHIGEAILNKKSSVSCNSWGKGQTASTKTRKSEKFLEKLVSDYLARLHLVCLKVNDTPSKHSDRAYLEQNIISLLAKQKAPIEIANEGWLGYDSPHEGIKNSSLWNLDHTDSSYDVDFLKILKEYCITTFTVKEEPKGAIAPEGWLHRSKTSYNQREINFD